MKYKSTKWLSISVFIAKSDWHFLLKYAIEPFIRILYRKEEIMAFNLQFSCLSGENIRLALLVPSDFTFKVAQKTDCYFKYFFRKRQLSPLPNKYTFNGIFMEYPRNVLQYGLYSTSALSILGNLFTFQQALSQAIIGAFAENVIDDDLILTFALYLIFCCHKIVSKSNGRLFLKIWSANYMDQTEYLKGGNDYDLIQFKYNELHSSIGEIYKDINSSLMGNNLIWLRKWENTFAMMLIHSKDQEIQCISEVIMVVKQQLSLSGFSIALLNKFILGTLSEQHNS